MATAPVPEPTKAAAPAPVPAAAAANADSDEEDEDYVPPAADSEDDGDDPGAIEDADRTASRLSAVQRRAVDDAFASLFGPAESPGMGDDGGEEEGSDMEIKKKLKGGKKKKKGKKTATAKGKKALQKKRRILADMFGGSAAAKMLSRSAAGGMRPTSAERKRDAPLLGLERRVVTERKRFAGQDVEIKRTVVGPAEGPGGSGGGVAALTAAPTGAQEDPPPPPLIPKAGGGLDSVLADLAGPQKISTVAKTSADWDTFKDRAGLEEELETKAKGKDAYLVKKDFLQRVDLRTFEVEKKERDRRRAAEGR